MINPDEPTTDWRIGEVYPLDSPARLADSVPLTPANRQTVLSGRRRAASVMRAEDDRLLVVVGPCSIHDRTAALTYAERLARVADRLDDQLVVVMRTYFEKPRTSDGWKGLVADPGMDDSFRVGDGLFAARALLVEILTLGLPVGCEFVDPMTTHYLADAVSWGCVGARTAESQVHRQLASGLAMPIGFKNSTSGDIQVAVDAVGLAGRPQLLVGIDHHARAAAAYTEGNPDAHVVLARRRLRTQRRPGRGGRSRPAPDPGRPPSSADGRCQPRQQWARPSGPTPGGCRHRCTAGPRRTGHGRGHARELLEGRPPGGPWLRSFPVDLWSERHRRLHGLEHDGGRSRRFGPLGRPAATTGSCHRFPGRDPGRRRPLLRDHQREGGGPVDGRADDVGMAGVTRRLADERRRFADEMEEDMP